MNIETFIARNHASWQNGPDEAPEISSADSYGCSVCLQEDNDPLDWFISEGRMRTMGHFLVGGKDVCGACIRMCDTCMEYMDDSTADRGPVVNYREVANDGKLTAAHAECIGEWMNEVTA